MLSIRILAVGNLKEKYLSDAVSEYQKRLTKYCKLEIIQIKEGDSKKESLEIRERLKGSVFFCDIGGELITSEGLAKKIESLSQTTSSLTFVIGGSNGLNEEIIRGAGEKISFGRITLPHQLFRVVLIEQIYRAFTIIKGESYHK